MASAEIEELFAKTLYGDYEDDAPWEAVRALRRLGTREVFVKAAEWCQSNEPLARARAADVLAQLGKTTEHRTNSFPEESYSAVVELLQNETKPRPLASAIAALGHLENTNAVPLIAQFHSHPSADVRFDVAFALGCFPNEALSVRILLDQMHDSDDNVRDWATFAVGTLSDADSSEIRDALGHALDDPDEDVHEEAMVGLAKRQDTRVLSTVFAAIQRADTSVRVLESAYLLLGMHTEKEGWQARDYYAALREKFPLP